MYDGWWTLDDELWILVNAIIWMLLDDGRSLLGVGLWLVDGG